MTANHIISTRQYPVGAAAPSTPLVTVGVALYNHERYIKRCLQSIVAQSYDHLEIIVIDDGSKDNSFSVAETYLRAQNVRSYLLGTRENRGICGTLNEIIDHAHGKYISFVGSDDYWHPNKIERHVAYLEQHPELALVHSNAYIIDNYDHITGKLDYADKINSGWLHEAIAIGRGGINTPCHLYRRDVFESVGNYDTRFSFEDTDFWLRLTKKYPVGFINEDLAYYRIHAHNFGRKDNLLRFYNDELIRIFNKNIHEEPLRRKAVSRIYRKSILRALRGLHLYSLVKLLSRWLLDTLYAKNRRKDAT